MLGGRMQAFGVFVDEGLIELVKVGVGRGELTWRRNGRKPCLDGLGDRGGESGAFFLEVADDEPGVFGEAWKVERCTDRVKHRERDDGGGCDGRNVVDPVDDSVGESADGALELVVFDLFGVAVVAFEVGAEVDGFTELDVHATVSRFEDGGGLKKGA